MAGFMPRGGRQRTKIESNKNTNQSHTAIPIRMQGQLGYINGEIALLLLVDECGQVHCASAVELQLPGARNANFGAGARHR